MIIQLPMSKQLRGIHQEESIMLMMEFVLYYFDLFV